MLPLLFVLSIVVSAVFGLFYLVAEAGFLLWFSAFFACLAVMTGYLWSVTRERSV